MNEEENKLSDQRIGKEVDWILDPGTVSTRTTQFVRTQAESWHMKTLLAKALGIQGEHAEQLQELQNFTEAMRHDHMAVVESSEFKRSSLEQQVDTIDKKLTVLIKLLRHVIGQDSKPSDMQKGDSTGDQQGNPPKPGQVNMSRSALVLEAFKHL